MSPISSRPVRVVIAGDTEDMRLLLRIAMAGHPELEVVGEAARRRPARGRARHAVRIGPSLAADPCARRPYTCIARKASGRECLRERTHRYPSR